MKLFIGLILSVLTTVALGQEGEIAKEVCYTDINTCGIYRVTETGTVVSITVTDNMGQHVDSAFKSHLDSLGIAVNQVASYNYGKIRAAHNVTETRNTTVEAEAYGLATISDEAWGLMIDSTTCAGGLLVCGTAAFTTAETGGLTLFLTRAACVGAGFACVSAMRSYQKWDVYQQNKKIQNEKLQKEKEEAKLKESASNPGGGGSGSGYTVVGPGGGTGGVGTPVGGGWQEEVIISEW